MFPFHTPENNEHFQIQHFQIHRQKGPVHKGYLYRTGILWLICFVLYSFFTVCAIITFPDIAAWYKPLVLRLRFAIHVVYRPLFNGLWRITEWKLRPNLWKYIPDTCIRTAKIETSLCINARSRSNKTSGQLAQIHKVAYDIAARKWESSIFSPKQFQVWQRNWRSILIHCILETPKRVIGK